MAVEYAPLLDVSDRIRRGELSSVEVTRTLLDRIARYDDTLHGTLLVPADEALAQARAADAEIAAGRWRGPLHGVPIGIKDLLCTKGLPTTAGMAILRDFRPAEDATVVERLKRAGAVIIAKLHMTEGATGEHHPTLPRPVNPWSPPHWTGISSSGSGVAPAAGFCFGAIGSDTAGSIRLPSAANGITGIKPTWGRVSRHGLIPLAETFDHLGPMARSAADAAAILQAIAGPDPRDPTSLPDPVPDYLAQMDAGIAGLTIGIDRDYATQGVAGEVVTAIEEAVRQFEALGATVRDVTFPWNDALVGTVMPLLTAEIGLAHEVHFPARADAYGPALRALLESSGTIDGLAVARGHVARDRFRGQVRSFFAGIDLFIVPALGVPVPRWDEVDALEGEVIRFTLAFNCAGVPTISLPAGFDAAGLPIGFQLAGPWLAEPALIRAGVAFQKATDHHLRHPDLDALKV